MAFYGLAWDFMQTTVYYSGDCGAQWLRRCATNWKFAGLITDGVTGISY